MTLSVDGKRIHIGCFKNLDEAKVAYDNAAKKYHGNFAGINSGSVQC